MYDVVDSHCSIAISNSFFTLTGTLLVSARFVVPSVVFNLKVDLLKSPLSKTGTRTLASFELFRSNSTKIRSNLLQS